MHDDGTDALNAFPLDYQTEAASYSFKTGREYEVKKRKMKGGLLKEEKARQRDTGLGGKTGGDGGGVEVGLFLGRTQ